MVSGKSQCRGVLKISRNEAHETANPNTVLILVYSDVSINECCYDVPMCCSARCKNELERKDCEHCKPYIIYHSHPLGRSIWRV